MKKFIAYLLVLIFIFTLIACGKDTTEAPVSSDNNEFEDTPQGISLVIIVGRHSNANMYTDEVLQRVEGLISKAFRYWFDETKEKQCAQAQIKVIVSDGRPVQIPITIDSEQTGVESIIQTNTEGARTKQVSDRVTAIMDFLRSEDLRANNEEVDLLGAISEAKTILDITPGVENHILILDTGINTTGKGSMVRDTPIDIYKESADDFIKSIPEDGFPSLDGIKVTFWGLGNVAAPQIDYRNNNNYKQWLVDVWTKIITKCGGELTSQILFSDSSGESMMWYEDGTGYPMVKPVYFVDTAPVQPESIASKEGAKIIDIKTEPQSGGVIVFQSAALNFIGDSTEFIDEQEPIRTIGSRIDEIKRYLDIESNAKVYVVGSIAKISPDEETKRNNPLSQGRAQKVADILINSYEISNEQIVIIDAGTTEFSWRPGGEFVNGQVNKKNQQNSRLVAIIGSGSTEVNELREKGFIN